MRTPVEAAAPPPENMLAHVVVLVVVIDGVDHHLQSDSNREPKNHKTSKRYEITTATTGRPVAAACRWAARCRRKHAIMVIIAIFLPRSG